MKRRGINREHVLFGFVHIWPSRVRFCPTGLLPLVSLVLSISGSASVSNEALRTRVALESAGVLVEGKWRRWRRCRAALQLLAKT